MSRYTELFQMLELGEPVEVKVASKTNFNTVRVKLGLLNQMNNGMLIELGESNLQRSLSGLLNKETLIATFQLIPLGEKRQSFSPKFTIITKPKENAEIQCNLGNPEEE